ncbi:UDP-N-acetylmuramoyl-tripeptide--D-alanyl-D-alanine ligase [Nocardioides aequoreus]|uniref:UDP-N-acetylmuramoyl-tripeptide--D-alanyl-D- alanine ligase n=1 Tax=Nocardioides aequoreus TaxID=397278 RepID=UPI00316AEA86
MTLGELAGVVGGVVADGDPGLVVAGPAFLDSRTPEPDGLFVAFAGEQADGHAYAAAAVAAGAAAVLGSRPTGVPTVVVDDARAALQELARVQLRRLREQGGHDGHDEPGGPAVVAVTGSQGKTSAKDLLARVLGDARPTVATAGSFNNELGLPLTVLRATPQTRFLVLEMGARGLGHLTELCRVAPPDVSLVLNVGKAHLGEFGSRDNIARAKGEIVEALAPGGTAVLNADDPRVRGMDARRPEAAVLRFGTAADADVRVDGLELDDLGRPAFDLVHAGGTEHVAMRLLGAHQATNAAAAAAVALGLGLPLADVAASLREVETLSRWRMELTERDDGLAVLNDAYNANPDSMRAALETLSGIGSRSGRRTVAVLGEMRELGADSDAEHRAVGALAADLGVDDLVVVGAPALADGHDERRGAGATRRTATADEASAWLRQNVAGPDVVLVKASRGAALERVAQALLETGEEAR